MSESGEKPAALASEAYWKGRAEGAAEVRARAEALAEGWSRADEGSTLRRCANTLRAVLAIGDGGAQ